MSNPINPLAKYRSYSYQQVLIVCDTTETAEALSVSNSYLPFLRSNDADRQNTPTDPYAKYEPYDVNLSRGRKGKYVIMISGAQDAEFVITKAHWYNTVAEAAGGTGNQYSTYNIGGEIEIMEPQGIRFMNVLSKVADELGSDPTGLVFMLKTIFVGHRGSDFESQGDGFLDPITNIRPILFWTIDIVGDFTITGGTYKLEFAGINHGVSKGQHILHGADRIKFDTAAVDEGCEANTLAGSLCKLQKRIKVIYDKYYNNIRTQVESAVDENGRPVVFTGRKVNYIIRAEEPYNSPEYLVTDFKDSATNTAETGKGGIIDLSSEPSVESAIMAIVKRCPKVQNDLVKGDGKTSKRVRYVPKVATTIESTDTEYNIVYKLRRVVESREDMLQVISNRTTDNTDDLEKNIRENLLELDYMYTGRNTDIIDFDLKMELGLVLFQSLSTTENIPDQSDSVQATSPSQKLAAATPVDNKYTFNNQPRKGTPIFLSTQVKKESIKHVTNPKRAVDFQELMNRHAAIENIEAVVKIHGNPGLLNTVNQPPSEIVLNDKYNTTNATTAGSDDENRDIFPYWERIPAIVQINIKMPSTYYGGARSSNDYSEDFWYRGFYYCYAIEQMFDGGEFTQQLHMVSLPKNSPEENKQANVTQTEQDIQTTKQNQNTKTPGSGTTAGTGGTLTSNNTQQPLTIVITKDASSYTSKQYQEEHSGNK